jgi:TonB family protein
VKSRLVFSGVSLLLVCGMPALARRSHGPSSTQESSQQKRVIKVPMKVVYAKLLRTVDPVYPPEAKAKGIQGTVVLRGEIGIDGRATDLKLVSGPRALAGAAKAAVRQWVFQPATFDGRRRPVPWTFRLNFQLGKDEGHPERNAVARQEKARELVHRVSPVYPADAARKGIHGNVVLRVLVGKDGHVKALSRVSGNPILAKAAIEAVRQWVYKPMLIHGEPVDVHMTVTVHFAPPKHG